ncbi:hypothetical protein BDW62DRAFT_206849 [Aspergillus aurantiobrunneus]
MADEPTNTNNMNTNNDDRITLLRQIWDAHRTGSGQRINRIDVAYHVLDQCDNESLLTFMEEDPGLSGLIFWQYGVRYRWPEEAYIPNNRQAVTLYHQRRARRLIRDEQRLDAQIRRSIAEATNNRAERLRLDQMLRRIRVEELNQRYQRLREQRLVIHQLQNRQRTQPFWASPTPAQQLSVDLARKIVPDIRRWMVEAQGEMGEINNKIVANEPPPAAPLPAIPNVPSPIPDETVRTNLAGTFNPIERLIERDCHVALRMLTRLGLFYPHQYVRTGHTCLHYAITHDSRRVARFLMDYYDTGNIIAQHGLVNLPSVPLNNNHLRVFAHYRWDDIFTEWCTRIFDRRPPIHFNAGAFFQQNERERMCSFATDRLATGLREHNLDLSTVVVQDIHQDENAWRTGATAWHLATRNRHALDFIEFLARANPLAINVRNLDGQLPIDLAVGLGDFEMTARLVHHGAFVADLGAQRLREPCTADDRWFRLYFNGIGAGLAATEWVHEVIEGLHQGITRGGGTRRERRRLEMRARALLRILRRGNGATPGNFGAIDDLGRTPVDVARVYHLYSLVYLLQSRTEPVNGRANDSRYALRTRRRRNYRV